VPACLSVATVGQRPVGTVERGQVVVRAGVVDQAVDGDDAAGDRNRLVVLDQIADRVKRTRPATGESERVKTDCKQPGAALLATEPVRCAYRADASLGG